LDFYSWLNQSFKFIVFIFKSFDGVNSGKQQIHRSNIEDANPKEAKPVGECPMVEVSQRITLNPFY